MAFPNGYGYRRKITIDNTKVSGGSNHSNFPVLISGIYDGTDNEPDLRAENNEKNLYLPEVSHTGTGTLQARTAFKPVNCTGLTQANGSLFIDIRCTEPTALTYAELEITSAGIPDSYEWNYDATSLFGEITSEYQTFEIPLSSFGVRDAGQPLNVSAINFIRLFILVDNANSKTLAWKNARIEYSTGQGNVKSPQGYDIIFTSDAAGNTQLDHEIEKYVAATGEIVMWVRIPTLLYN